MLEPTEISDAKHLLQFITLLWQVDARATAFIHPQSISSLLLKTLQRLRTINTGLELVAAGGSDGEAQLLHPLLAALAAMHLAKRRAITPDKISNLPNMYVIWEVATSAIAPEDPLAIGKRLSQVFYTTTSLDTYAHNVNSLICGVCHRVHNQRGACRHDSGSCCLGYFARLCCTRVTRSFPPDIRGNVVLCCLRFGMRSSSFSLATRARNR